MRWLLSILAVAALGAGPGQLIDPESVLKPPAPKAEAVRPKIEVTPPASVSSSGTLATKDDIDASINSLAGRLQQILAPMEQRLAAVEAKVDQHDRELATRGRAVDPLAAPQAPATKVWAFRAQDASGTWCYGVDEADLSDRLRRRNEWFAERSTRVVNSYSAPAYTVAPPVTYSVPSYVYTGAMPAGYAVSYGASYGGGAYGGGATMCLSPGGCR